MPTNRSAPPGVIVPSLIYSDVAKAIDWLSDTFGFTERLRITGPDGRVGHAQLMVGSGDDGAGGGVLLGESRVEQVGKLEFRPPHPNEISTTLSVHIGDVDQHFEHARARGAHILQVPTTFPFGERQYVAFDLEGYRWTFSQTVADIPPEAWGATTP